MKNVLIFIGGMATGILLMVIVGFILYSIGTKQQTTIIENENVASLYEGFENGEIIHEKSFQIFQVLEDNVALVNGRENGLYIGPVYLLIGKEGTTFYDEQIVKVPEGGVVRMNGTFQYETKNGMDKTVPKIMIMEK
ncbi:MAG: hypothetical protein J6T38_09935 [Bacteroidaceae bacterium]|nr:hypothetical protein [Bacteroidaceae bacterium]